jgi:hypothetical protein
MGKKMSLLLLCGIRIYKMKKIILLSLFVVPFLVRFDALFSTEVDFKRDRFYVDGHRRVALEAGVVAGVTTFAICTRLANDPVTLVDGLALAGGISAIVDGVARYPVSDGDFERDHFAQLGQVNDTKKYFARGFATAAIGFSALKLAERVSLGGSDVLTAGEGVSVFAGALVYNAAHQQQR